MAENGQLLIQNISPKTNVELSYWCQIRNRLTGETFLSQSAGKIKLTEHQGGVPPSISHISETVSVELGESAEMSCAGQGYPPPTYVWKSNYNGKVLSKGPTLEIKDLSKSGTFTYSCIVQNKFGSDESKSSLIVRGKYVHVSNVIKKYNIFQHFTIQQFSLVGCKSKNIVNISWSIYFFQNLIRVVS